MSPSTRGCGLKWNVYTRTVLSISVTLHARVWIEIETINPNMTGGTVTLHARVWIEISADVRSELVDDRHPPREGVD